MQIVVSKEWRIGQSEGDMQLIRKRQALSPPETISILVLAEIASQHGVYLPQNTTRFISLKHYY